MYTKNRTNLQKYIIWFCILQPSDFIVVQLKKNSRSWCYLLSPS